jgi:hypothetical protein
MHPERLVRDVVIVALILKLRAFVQGEPCAPRGSCRRAPGDRQTQQLFLLELIQHLLVMDLLC